MKVFFDIIRFSAIFLALGLEVSADTVIYDTSKTYNTNLFSMANGLEIGNQITLSPNTWSMTSFNVEYYSTGLLNPQNVGVDLRFYFNNGAPFNGYATPGTLFYDSGWNYGNLVADPTGDTITYSKADLYQNALLNLPAGFLLPGTFTFTVTFTNLDAANTIDLPLANSPSGQPASSSGDYWLNTNGKWSLLTNSVAANVVGLITAVPEPAAGYLAALGSILLLGAGRLVQLRRPRN